MSWRLMSLVGRNETVRPPGSAQPREIPVRTSHATSMWCAVVASQSLTPASVAATSSSVGAQESLRSPSSVRSAMR